MKQINKIAIFTISVLTAKLLSEFLFDYLIKYRKNGNPYFDTLVGMAIIAFIFFPALTLMNKYLKILAETYLKTSKKASKKSSSGLIWAVFAALIVLYYLYLRSWYGIDLFKAIFSIFTS